MRLRRFCRISVLLKNKNGKIYMRIGIVSQYGYHNYGNRLQNYALQCILQKKGATLSIKNKAQSHSLINWIKEYTIFSTSFLLHKLFRKLKRLEFIIFDNEYVNSSCKVYSVAKAYMKLCDKDSCELYCVGSDQVWKPTSPCCGPIHFLGFAERDRTFSYAASFGIDHIPEECVEDVRKGLEHIKFISVREDAGKRIVEELTGRTDVYVHVDPTMLLTAEEWDKVSKKPKQRIPEKYILTYFLGDVSEARRAAIENKAKELGCELVELMDKNGPYYNNGPSEFLYLIKHAAMVCTDSFHGSVFSFLYERPFVIFDRAGSGENMSSRLETLCSKFGLGYCMVRGDEIPELPMTPDYSEGFAVLETERNRSKDYFDMVFEEAERLGLCK